MGNNGTAMTTFDRVECIWNLYLPPVDKDDFTKDSFESLSPSWSVGPHALVTCTPVRVRQPRHSVLVSAVRNFAPFRRLSVQKLFQMPLHGANWAP